MMKELFEKKMIPHKNFTTELFYRASFYCVLRAGFNLFKKIIISFICGQILSDTFLLFKAMLAQRSQFLKTLSLTPSFTESLTMKH
jgi:hypothetical protein